MEQEIAGGLPWPKPWLALNPAFQPGGSVSDLAEAGLLHPTCREIFRHRPDGDPMGQELAFHKHQADAIEIAARRESYVLTTGPGRASRCPTSCRSWTGSCARAPVAGSARSSSTR